MTRFRTPRRAALLGAATTLFTPAILRAQSALILRWGDV